MKRIRVVVVGTVALLVSVVSPAEAATPVSVVGIGKTKMVFCATNSSCSSGVKANVIVDAVRSRGLLVIQGFAQGPVNCVQSAVVNGRKGVVVEAASVDFPSARLVLAINEGGGGRQPWAVATQVPRGSGRLPCNSAGARLVASDSGCPGCSVPASRYVVVGG